MRTIQANLPGTSGLYAMARYNCMYMSPFQPSHASRPMKIWLQFSCWLHCARRMERMWALSQSGTRTWRLYRHSTSWQLIVSLGKSRLMIDGGLLTKATDHSMWLCMDYGNQNTSQRMITIEIYLFCILVQWAWQWMRIRRRVILGSNYKKIQVVYTKKAHAFYNLPWNFGAGLLVRGCTYKKKIAYTRLPLSLSPLLEERARGEVGGSWTNHPTAIFGQRVPYLAGLRIVISSQRTVSIEKVFISEFIMAVHEFLIWQYMIFKIFLSPYQVVDPVEPHPLLRLVRYLLPDPGGSHQFPQLVCTYSADWWNWWPVPSTGPTIHRDMFVILYISLLWWVLWLGSFPLTR